MGEKLKKGNYVKKMSFITLLITFLLFIWYICADRYTPSTDQARVKGLVLPIAPLVSGYITQVNVNLHSRVKQGDTLFIIDRKPYEIAVKVAESNLEKVSQSIGAGTSSLKVASAQLNRARVQLDRASRNWERVKKVITQNEGALSQADKDKSETAYLEAIQGVATAQANLNQQKEALGPLNSNNPSVKAALSQLEKAQWDLENTVIIAASNGIIESFNVEEGYFAGAGKPIATLIGNKIMWVQANLKENNLSYVEKGNRVKIIFDIAPGKIFKGMVSSVAYGVSTDATNAGGLPAVKTSQGWLRDPQRFPVIIDIEDVEILKKLRQGSQAEVVVYTGNNFILNSLASLRIWVLSKLSYVR